jgi:small subunit ribosomal protein S7
VAKFIASIMRDGKKSVAESIFYGAFDIIEEKTKRAPLKVFEQAVENVRPMIEVKSRRVGGSTYQVPTEIRPSRRTALAIRWMIGYARKQVRTWHGQQTGRRIDGCRQPTRRRSVKKKGRYPQDGGGQQGFCALPLVTGIGTITQ